MNVELETDEIAANDDELVTSHMQAEVETSAVVSESDNKVEMVAFTCESVNIGVEVATDVVDCSRRGYSTSEADMDSADIIPEAAMKCGIIPLGSLITNDEEEDYMCNHDNEFNFDGSSDPLLHCTTSADDTPLQISLSIASFTDDCQQQDPAASPTDVDAKVSTSYSSVSHDAIRALTSATSGQPVLVETCAGCQRAITDRYLLRAVELNWHEECLRCSCCNCRLGEVGATLFTRSNLLLCKRDYLRLFGATGYCSACSKVIQAFEMIMRAKNNVYHLECFACQRCNQRFCMGDKFYLSDNKILCELDYENDSSKRYASDLNTSSSAALQHQQFSSSVIQHQRSSMNPIATSSTTSCTTVSGSSSTTPVYRNGGHVNGNHSNSNVKQRQGQHNIRIQHQQQAVPQLHQSQQYLLQHQSQLQRVQHINHQVLLQQQQQLGASLVAAASSNAGTVLGCSTW